MEVALKESVRDLQRALERQDKGLCVGEGVGAGVSSCLGGTEGERAGCAATLGTLGQRVVCVSSCLGGTEGERAGCAASLGAPGQRCLCVHACMCFGGGKQSQERREKRGPDEQDLQQACKHQGMGGWVRACMRIHFMHLSLMTSDYGCTASQMCVHMCVHMCPVCMPALTAVNFHVLLPSSDMCPTLIASAHLCPFNFKDSYASHNYVNLEYLKNTMLTLYRTGEVGGAV
eukprot:1141517-Pelagomonas_calceolata.AAC.5